MTLRRSLRRGLPRGLLLKYLSFRLHKSWYQEETSRGPQHKALRALRCSWFRSVSTLSELLIRVPANSKLDLIISETLPQVFVRSRTTSTLTCISRLFYVFGSISDSKVCGSRFFFSSFSILLAPGVVVRGKTVDQPTSTERAPFTYRKFIGILISRLFAHSVYRPFTELSLDVVNLGALA